MDSTGAVGFDAYPVSAVSTAPAYLNGAFRQTGRQNRVPNQTTGHNTVWHEATENPTVPSGEDI